MFNVIMDCVIVMVAGGYAMALFCFAMRKVRVDKQGQLQIKKAGKWICYDNSVATVATAQARYYATEAKDEAIKISTCKHEWRYVNGALNTRLGTRHHLKCNKCAYDKSLCTDELPANIRQGLIKLGVIKTENKAKNS